MAQPQNPYTQQEFIQRYLAGTPRSPYYQEHGITPEMGWLEAAGRTPAGTPGLIYQGMGDAYDRWQAELDAKKRYRELHQPTLMGTPTTSPQAQYQTGVATAPLPSPPTGMAATRPAPQAVTQTMPGQMRTTAPIDESARSAFLARTKGAGASQAALAAGLKSQFKGKGARKARPTKNMNAQDVNNEIKHKANHAGLMASAKAGNNYDGALLSLIISARRQAAQNQLAFVPLYDYKARKLVLVRPDGVDMVFDMRNPRHRGLLQSSIAVAGKKGGYTLKDVMKLADRTSRPLAEAITRGIETEEDLKKALETPLSAAQ